MNVVGIIRERKASMEPIEGGSATHEEEAGLGRFIVAHGGPFYGLQKQIGLLREDAFSAGPRAFMFV